MSSIKEAEIRTYLDRLVPNGIEGLIEESRQERARGGALESTEVAPAALENLSRGKSLTTEQAYYLEAIIIPDKRPAIDIKNGVYEVDHELWRHFNTDDTLRSNIERAIRSIGRIEVPDHPRVPYGGTGFVVGDGLIMTNRHVAELFTSGVGIRHVSLSVDQTAGIDFKREIGDTMTTMLKVKRVVMVHPYWDMAVLAVEGLSPNSPALHLAINELPSGRDVAVIGYPAFDPRNDAKVQNKVFRGVYDVKRLQPGKANGRRDVGSFGKRVSALIHDSSTLGGNSGSAVINPQSGEVVALHFGGVYLDTNYGVPAWELARDGRVVDAGLNFSKSAPGGTPPWARFWEDSEGEERVLPAQQSLRPVQPAAEDIKLVVPLEITIRCGAAITTSSSGAASGAVIERAVEPRHDTSYKGRGYNPSFLARDVPLPDPADEDVVARMSNGDYVIHYNNFSVVMHAKRRIALFTASNVTAEKALKTPDPSKDYSRKVLGGLGGNDRERWFADPRLDAAFQLPDRFFTNDRGAFDKGHLVRREDVAWGKTYDDVVRANGDTYHVTNCSPQVAEFNQASKGELNWGRLEDLVLKQAKTERLCVFCGPILDKADPTFIGVDDSGAVRVQIPTRYWKVIVAHGVEDLEAFGFVLEQDLSNVDTELIVPDVWKSRMAKITAIEGSSGVRFPKVVRKADQHGRRAGRELRAQENLEPYEEN